MFAPGFPNICFVDSIKSSYLAGQLESADANIYGTYMFRRCDFDSCLPYTFFPCAKPTLMVRVSPVKYELREDVEQNLSELPYRLIFAVMCAESIFFYDSQTDVPIGFVYDLSYDNLTSISWSPDGKMLAVSSLEGFNTFLHIQTNQLLPTKLTIERAMSPPLKKPKEKKQELEFSVSLFIQLTFPTSYFLTLINFCSLLEKLK